MTTANLSRILTYSRYRYGDVDALVFESRRWTYRQLDDDVNALAASLLDLGVGRGDRFAVLCTNLPEYLILALALAKIGAVLVPLNHRLHSDELTYLLTHCGAVGIASEPAFASKVDELAPACPGLRLRIALESGCGAAWHGAAGLIASHQKARVPDAEVADGDLQRILYTSGTTSRPKGALLTHGNVNANMYVQIADLGLRSGDRVLNFAPLYHVGGLDMPGFATWQVGATMHLVRRFDVPSILEIIARERITGTTMVATMLHLIRNSEARLGFDGSSVRWLIFGQVPAVLLPEMNKLFPSARLVDGYGLTETCNGVTYLDAAHAVSKRGSVGRPLPLVDLRVVDDDDEPVPAGELGEIVLRGPKVCAGYLDDAKATEQAMRGGWFHTGDVGRLDEDGYLYVVDRKKDMIKSGGENIASSEIEAVVYDHPAVAEAAVVGVPDPTWGEAPVLCVVARPGLELDIDDLLEHCRGRLGRFKVPRRVVLMRELPRTLSGKVLKRELRESLLSVRSDQTVGE